MPPCIALYILLWWKYFNELINAIIKAICQCALRYEKVKGMSMCIFFFFRILTLFMWKHVPSGGGFLKRLFSSLCCSLVTKTITQLSSAGELLCKQFQAIWREEQRRFFLLNSPRIGAKFWNDVIFHYPYREGSDRMISVVLNHCPSNTYFSSRNSF